MRAGRPWAKPSSVFSGGSMCQSRTYTHSCSTAVAQLPKAHQHAPRRRYAAACMSRTVAAIHAPWGANPVAFHVLSGAHRAQSRCGGIGKAHMSSSPSELRQRGQLRQPGRRRSISAPMSRKISSSGRDCSAERASSCKCDVPRGRCHAVVRLSTPGQALRQDTGPSSTQQQQLSQQSSSDPSTGSALAAIPRRMHRISSDLRS